MRACAICGAETAGTLLCVPHQLQALRTIRKDAAEREDQLREEDPDA